MASFLSAHQHARRRLRRPARAPGAPAARGDRRGARARRCGRPAAVVGCRYLGDEVDRRRQPRSTTPRAFGVALRRAPAWTSCRSPRAASSRTPSSRRSARPPIRTPGRRGYECMPTDLLGRARPVRAATRRSPAAIRRRRARGAGSPPRWSPPAASASFDAGRGDPEPRRRRHRRRGAPEPRRSRLVRARCGRAAAHEVRRCHFTNYCEALDQQHKQVTCKLWDRVELDEPGVARSHDGRRRLLAPRWRR